MSALTALTDEELAARIKRVEHLHQVCAHGCDNNSKLEQERALGREMVELNAEWRRRGLAREAA